MAVIGVDREAGALVCVEEPENGIHPASVGVVLELLKRAAVDPGFAVDEDNPLRQIIVNTHSPILVRNLLPEEVIICQAYRFDSASLSIFSPLQNTWRDRDAVVGLRSGMPVGLGAVLAYLDGESESARRPSGKLSIEQEYKQQIAPSTPK